ncbi:DEAD/DEAH box helicase [Aphelenchoides besseyi]|nr:DEAD/DEAH box helicase [Aphelenchoides besseyi]
MAHSSRHPYSIDKFVQKEDLFESKYTNEQFEEELKCAYFFSKDSNNQPLQFALSYFEDAKLCLTLAKSMKQHNIIRPTPIQTFAIPYLLEYHTQNFRISAAPGSGKTLVYALPMIDYIIRKKHKLRSSHSSLKPGQPFAVVICPTPSTAIQLKSVLSSLRGPVETLSICTLLANAEDDESTRKERQNCDIVIGTLGLVTKHFFSAEAHQSPTFKTLQLKYVVVDDCSSNIRNEAANLFRCCGTSQCSLIVVDSETLNAPGELEELLSKKSIELVIRTPRLPKNVRHEFWEMKCWEKSNELVDIIKNYKAEGQILVFVNDIQNSFSLFHELKQRLIDDELLVDLLGPKEAMSEERRLRVIRNLVNGVINVLIVNGEHPIRGLNFQNVSHVVHYDLPRNLVDYHRQSGRCGFANCFGTVINFVTPDDRNGDIISYCREICDSSNAIVPACWR